MQFRALVAAALRSIVSPVETWSLMCEVYERAFTGCCTALCSRRKNIAPLENIWCYTPTGTAINELLYLQNANSECVCAKNSNSSSNSSSNLNSRSNSNSACNCAATVASVVDTQPSTPQAIRGDSGNIADHDDDQTQNNVKCDGDDQGVVSASTSAAYLSRSGSEAQKALDARSNKKLSKERSTSPKGAVNVRLTRTAGVQLGLGIAGGSDRAFPPTISFLRPGFIAHRCDQLQIGERLTHVNGIPVDGLTHDQVLALLRNAGTDVQLQVEYDLNNRCFTRSQHTMSKCTDIVLEKERGSFGLTLRGGAYGPDRSKSRPITITNIRTGGPAHREGRLRVGDRVLCINGVDVYSATLAVAQRLLEESLNSATVTIEYDVSVLESVRKASGALVVEIDKAAGSDLGVMLKINEADPARNTQRSIIIDSITPASIADSAPTLKFFRGNDFLAVENRNVVGSEFLCFTAKSHFATMGLMARCGALHCGDEILSVDGIGLEYTTLAEARQLLRGQAPTVRLEILPLSQMQANENEKSAMKGHLEKKVRAISHAYSRKTSNNGTISVCFSPPENYTQLGCVDKTTAHSPGASECEADATCASGQRLTTKGAIGGSVPNMQQETTRQKPFLSAPSTSMGRSCCKFRASDLHNGNSKNIPILRTQNP
uniref:PDZ domain-containing protein n=1 Tax=Ascaris lumbricoides TaxID=6252 RepID=A0A9J2PAL5_ASCLU